MEYENQLPLFYEHLVGISKNIMFMIYLWPNEVALCMQNFMEIEIKARNTANLLLRFIFLYWTYHFDTL